MSRSLRFRLVIFLIGLFTAMALRGPSRSDTPEKADAGKKSPASEIATLPTAR